MSSKRSLLPFWESPAIRTAFGGPAFLWLLIITAFGTLVCLFNIRGPLLHLPASLKQARVEDMAAFYRASEMSNYDAASYVYDPSLFRDGLSERLSDLIFLNPPHALPVFHVFAWTDFATVKIGFICLTLIALFAIPRMAGQTFALSALFAASAAPVQILLRLNLSVFVIALIVYATMHARSRPVLSGLALSVATIKPQYGLLVPFFLAGIGAWRCIAWATIGTLSWMIVTLVMFGPGVFESYLAAFSTPLYQAYALTALEWDTSFRSFLGRLGVAADLRTALVLAAIVAGAVCAFRLPRDWPCGLRVGMLLLLSTLVAPSFMYYSWPLFAAGVLFIARALPDWPIELQFLAGLTWMQPLIYMLLLPLLPAVLTAHAATVFLLMALLVMSFFLLARRRAPGPALRGSDALQRA
ncbi:glycosyltransferase family 87 protein [Roseibium sp. MMSF_3412]|uniref:glycosyltransferase family 87 protein n=1 Tax=Roseibium sp. MMSF_3412 TaxID=3046712 RepID=UPI00273F2828|nr:glycosyltransferase family 87 protein [Roseibium sp. MMSF_3412]